VGYGIHISRADLFSSSCAGLTRVSTRRREHKPIEDGGCITAWVAGSTPGHDDIFYRF
jgi:hypothetical protein